MNITNMTLGEFYEKADKAVAELNDLNSLTLQHFNEATEADLKNAGLLEDPIFLRNGTIYFSLKDVYHTNNDDDASRRSRTELELGTIHASYREDFSARRRKDHYALLAEITHKLDYPLDAPLSDLAQEMRLQKAKEEKKRIEQEVEEMMTKLSDYKKRISELNQVIDQKGAVEK